jgi:putative DNA methylase
MAWDFCEANPLSSSSGSWEVVSRGLDKGLEVTTKPTGVIQGGVSLQSDAAIQSISRNKVVSTDPPHTMTILATQIYQTSFTVGCVPA